MLGMLEANNNLFGRRPSELRAVGGGNISEGFGTVGMRMVRISKKEGWLLE